MKLLLVNCAEPKIRKFISPLEKITGAQKIAYQTVEYRALTDFDIDNFSGVIISGSPQGDDIILSHQPYFKWLKNYTKPVLGICAGHHIIGVMYGAKVFSSMEIENGEVEIIIQQKVKIFEGFENTFYAETMHNDSISVPKGFELIASTKTCINEAMKKNDRDWFTLQFHPEINNPEIIINFINLVKEKNQ